MQDSRHHHYATEIIWTGNRGAGTSEYKAYGRDYEISVVGKPTIFGSSDLSFRGDKTRYSPEDLLLAALSGCHMLWYLHLCAVHGVVVVDYRDHAAGEMMENSDGSGQFVKVTLHPNVTVADNAMLEKAKALHRNAYQMCFIARSVNFPVDHLPEITCRNDV